MDWKKRWPWLVGAVVVGGAGAGVYTSREYWLPSLTRAISAADSTSQNQDSGREHDDGHAGHAHAEDLAHVSISDQAKLNLGLEIGEVTLQDYWRTVVIPGEVAEEPGHCERKVTTPLNGIVLKVYALQGQTVKPGDPLFEIQPTSELLMSAQSNLLKTIQELDVADREIKRLSAQVETGTLAKNQILSRESERRRLDSLRLVQMQELLVRGLGPDQIQELMNSQLLIRKVTIRVPEADPVSNTTSKTVASQPEVEVPSAKVPAPAKAASTEEQGSTRHLGEHQHSHGSVYTVESLNVSLGKLIQPGEELCQLASHTVLLIEGRAFERESNLITKALEEQWPITAEFETAENQPLRRENLTILYVDNSIDGAHRTLHFYVPLKNEVVRDNPGINGLVYRTWRFKPGQKVRLLLPVEHLSERIVLPADAIVKEGPDAYVFRANGSLMEQVPVSLEYLDPRDAVLKNDGSLFEGDEVARNQAYQLHLALKKAEGEGSGGHDHGHDH